MFPRVPRVTVENKLYAPLLDVLNEIFMTPHELGDRWRYTQAHLSNLRRAGKGPRYIKLAETGGIRYFASDIVASEISGTAGKITLSDVELAATACTSVPEEHRVAMLEHLRATLAAR